MPPRKKLIEVALKLIVKASLTILIGILIFLHLFGLIAVDAPSIVLIILILLIWTDNRVLHEIWDRLSSVEFMGNKISLTNLENKEDKLASAGLITNAENKTPSITPNAISDPNLALAGLRIEIEKSLRELAVKKHLVDNTKPTTIRELMRVLLDEGLLTEEEYSALSDLNGTLNRAVHGADVSPSAALWAMQVGPSIVSAIKKKQ